MPSTISPVSIIPTLLPPVPMASDSYSELQGSPREEYTNKGPRVSRQLIAPYDQRHDIAKAFKGFSRFVEGRWFVTPPQTWPDLPQAEVTNVAISPFDERALPKNGDTRFATYKMAQLDVTYEIPENKDPQQVSRDGKPDIYVTEDIEVHSQFLTMGSSNFFWGEYTGGGPWNPAAPDAHIWVTPLKTDEAPQTLLKTFTWVYTRHKMAEIPSFMLDFVGCVNQNAVTSLTLNFDFPAETLLFDEPRLSRDITAEGVQEWKVTMKMVYRPWGWQLFWRPGRLHPEPIWYIPPSVADKHGKIPVGSSSATEYVQRWKPYTTAQFELITG